MGARFSGVDANEDRCSFCSSPTVDLDGACALCIAREQRAEHERYLLEVDRLGEEPSMFDEDAEPYPEEDAR